VAQLLRINRHESGPSRCSGLLPLALVGRQFGKGAGITMKTETLDNRGHGRKPRRRGLNAHNLRESDRALALRRLAWSYHLEGRSVRWIGVKLGRSKSTVSQCICDMREMLLPESHLTRLEMCLEARERLLEAMDRLMPHIGMGNLAAAEKMTELLARFTTLAGLRNSADVADVELSAEFERRAVAAAASGDFQGSSESVAG